MLITNHKPLLAILGPKQGIPPLAAAQMQRWALLLAAYNYEIEFRSIAQHSNADALSLLPLPGTTPVGNPHDATIFNFQQLDSLPVSAREIAAATRADPILKNLLKHLKRGWPNSIPNSLNHIGRRERASALKVTARCGGIESSFPPSSERR